MKGPCRRPSNLQRRRRGRQSIIRLLIAETTERNLQPATYGASWGLLEQLSAETLLSETMDEQTSQEEHDVPIVIQKIKEQMGRN